MPVVSKMYTKMVQFQILVSTDQMCFLFVFAEMKKIRNDKDCKQSNDGGWTEAIEC